MFGGLKQELCEIRHVHRSHPPREPLLDLLQAPAVAVGIGERCPAEVRAALRVGAAPALAGFVVPDLADVDAAADQVVAGRFDVLDRSDTGPAGTQRQGRPAVPELDRSRRAGWSELHRARVLVGLEVDVETPSQTLVEGLGAVDVGDRQRRDLSLIGTAATPDASVAVLWFSCVVLMLTSVWSGSVGWLTASPLTAPVDGLLMRGHNPPRPFPPTW
jgi:hypothetical protein